MGRVFSTYGTPMAAVSSFRYLGQTLSSSNNDWTAVERNSRRARGKWGRLAKILGREAADRIMTGRFMWRWCKRCSRLGPRRGL